MRIWQRYLFSHLLRTLLFFFLCLLTLYIAIDFSINGVRFLSKDTTSWLDIGINYLRHFAKFLDLFFSLSFLLASLKVLLDLNAHREIVALQIAGLSAKKLLAPFYITAVLLAAASYANSQWISPDAQMAADDFYKAHSKKIDTKSEERVFSLELQDGSELVYQSYDWEKKELFDVFWIRSPGDLWHMKHLQTDVRPVAGRFADHFLRNDQGLFEKVESFESHAFPELQWNEAASLQKFIPFENRPLTLLFQQTLSHGAEKQKSAAYLHYKLALPLVPLLMLFAIAPSAFRFSRGRSAFLLVACSFAAYVGLRTFLDAMLILAENQVLSPLFAIWGPLAIGFAIALHFFSRLR